MAHKYMKADEWMGRHLSLHVGRGQKTIQDSDVLKGPKWGKFVGMGFLKSVSDDVAEKAAAAPPPPPEREPMLSAPVPPEALTKAPKMPAPGKSTSTSTEKTATKKTSSKKTSSKKTSSKK